MSVTGVGGAADSRPGGGQPRSGAAGVLDAAGHVLYFSGRSTFSVVFFAIYSSIISERILISPKIGGKPGQANLLMLGWTKFIKRDGLTNSGFWH